MSAAKSPATITSGTRANGEFARLGLSLRKNLSIMSEQIKYAVYS